MSGPTLGAALRLVGRGVHVFPCATNGKLPLTEHGFKDATTNATVVREWFGRWPRANLAIACGASRLVVIDLDRKNGIDGARTLHDVQCDLEALPRTLAASTPSGGLHLFYRAPPDVEIGCSAGRVSGSPAPGLDVRAIGGYVVCAPSTIDGRAYVWRDRLPLANLPRPWVDALASKTCAGPETPIEPWRPRTYNAADRVAKYVHRALEGEVDKVASAPLGTRNARLYDSAHALGGLVHTGLVDEDEIRRALLSACASWPRTERDESKDRGTIERGVSDGASRPRQIEEARRAG